MDSRKKTLTETAMNIGVGFAINYGANFAIVPYYAIRIINEPQNIPYLMAEMGGLFTIIAVTRTYGFRRLFERFGEKENFYTLSVRLYNRIKKSGIFCSGCNQLHDIANTKQVFVFGDCPKDAKDDGDNIISPCLKQAGHEGKCQHVGLCKTNYCICHAGRGSK